MALPGANACILEGNDANFPANYWGGNIELSKDKTTLPTLEFWRRVHVRRRSRQREPQLMKKKVNSFSGSTLLRLRVFGVKNIKFPRSIGEEISKQNANELCCGHNGDDSSSCFLYNVRRNTFNLASLHWRTQMDCVRTGWELKDRLCL